jgi:hypothetical protein
MFAQRLNTTTDAIFAQNIQTTNIGIAMAYYENALCGYQPYRPHRWHFQTRLAEWSLPFFIGYFALVNKNEIRPNLRKHFVYNPAPGIRAEFAGDTIGENTRIKEAIKQRGARLVTQDFIWQDSPDFIKEGSFKKTNI